MVDTIPVLSLITDSQVAPCQILCDGPDIVLGRHSKADVVLHSQSVSRFHCSIKCDNNNVSLTDVRSQNGTYVNNEQIKGTVVLKEGDIIAIGPIKEDLTTEFIYRFGYMEKRVSMILKRKRQDTKESDSEENSKKKIAGISKSESTDNIEVTNRLLEEFICPVCRELTVCAVTLQCGHTFCRECIHSWLKSRQKKRNTCPECQQLVLRPPIRSRHIDRVLQCLTESGSSEDLRHWEGRRTEIVQEEDKLYASLQKSLRESRATSFLDIREEWNADDQTLFRKGSRKYCGKARSLYCKLIGLTHAFIAEEKRESIIRTAASNIGLELQNMSIVEVKQHLLSFVNDELFL